MAGSLHAHHGRTGESIPDLLVFENWLEYSRNNYMGVAADGKLEWFTSFYDPTVNYKLNAGALAGLGMAFYVLPQNREFASFIYDAAAARNRWNDASAAMTNLSAAGLVLARELGDQTSLARLSAAAERDYEPRFFGADNSRFGWWFQLKENYPRGQRSALMMVAEVGKGGDWIRGRRLLTRREAVALCGSAFGATFVRERSDAATQGRARAARLDWSEVDAKLQGSIDDKTFEGVGLLLCTAEGAFYKKAFGADTTETAHLLGSATKLASTTAIMTLVDDKLIKLDDPIRKCLPQFGPVRGAITIRQLFAQTHAMPANHPSIAAPLRDNGITLEESVNRIATDDTVRYPVGSKHEYQPAVSYHIGGRIAEVVTGTVWNELFDRRVRIPLDMQTFTYGETRNPRIGGGAKCALQDYGNLLQMHLAGGVFKGRRVLSEASVREMQKDQLNGVPFTAIGRTNGYGLSWWFEAMADGGKGIQMSGRSSDKDSPMTM